MSAAWPLRLQLTAIKEDDRRILWEGIDVLTTEELREACQERGMQSFDLTEFQYKRQLQEWLDLSIQKSIPISLLIMSRAFMISSTSLQTKPEDVLQSSMSSLDSDLVNEVVLAVAKPSEAALPEIQRRKVGIWAHGCLYSVLGCSSCVVISALYHLA